MPAAQVIEDAELRADAPSPPARPFVKGLFHWLAEDYDRAVLTYSLGQDLRWKSTLVKAVRPRPGDRALDLACGTGLIMERLGRELGDPAVVGMDINRTMLLKARGYGADRNLIQGDAESIPLADASVDIVTAGYLPKYVQLDRFAREVARVLRTGGRFACYDFSRPLRATLTGRAYSLYLHRVLPGVAGGFANGDSSWRTLFEFLAHVAETSGWETRIVAALDGAEFESVKTVPSLGGAVTWVWAVRRGR